MSSEPRSSETTSSRPSSGGPAAGAKPLPPARDYFGADAELVLTALSRMVAAIRGERATLDLLLTALGEMADAIAQAKSAMQPRVAGPADAGIDLAALLDELEHRVDGMLDIVNGGAPPAQRHAPPMPAAIQPPQAGDASRPAIGSMQGDRVPTVSGVVSRLGRGQDAPATDSDTGAAAHGAGDADVPTVSMLEAMVEALNASVPATVPDAESTPQADEAPTQALEASFELTAPLSFPGDRIVPESELLAGFAELVAMPIPPPEVGTVVIFTAAAAAKAEPPEQPQEQPHDEEPAVERLRQPLPTLDLPEMVPARFLAAAPADEPEPEPAASSLEPPEESALPALESRQPPATDAGFDWASGLVREVAEPPEPEPPLAEIPAPVPAVAQPLAMQSPAAGPSAHAQPSAAKAKASDPLAPLKAMSPAEKIALFS
jgi:hypothetical protein